ncbi:C39 family peptidase [Ectobacillus sp. JY-23]|uniref:C39 family peptidase n=1 Tax=Ectobacillus sp. JY-23 TaxID=2933872 RepID=UPI001FF625D5|nr:C39 family peptidase [Ectobacillus sp. JY-23]UOY93967.1 C39 family peptidase [Ectobacillus sp. JY-23]
MLKKAVGIGLVLALGITTSSASASATTGKTKGNPVTVGEESLQGNLWIQTTKTDFDKGAFVDTISTEDGNGSIMLVKNSNVYTNQGTYVSATLAPSLFTELVMSWNADTPKGTSIKVEGQVRVKGKWSEWVSWGTWTTSAERTSESNSNSLATMSVDTLIPKSESDGFRYRLTLKTTNPNVSPKVNLVSTTIANSSNPIQKVYNDGIAPEQLASLNKVIDVPQFSQMIRDPEIANSICSPTTMTMLLNRKGESTLPEQNAWNLYDTKFNSYGNWTFNAAYAGSFGYEAYIEYMNSKDDIKREIIKGNPVGISVQYRNDESINKSYPVVHGAPIASTPGHILVVKGFVKDPDGKEYFIVNDPASANDLEVERRYLASELDAAWATSGRITYIVHDKITGDGIVPPKVENATIAPTGNTRTVNGTVVNEYKLIYNGAHVDVSRNPDATKEPGITIMYRYNSGPFQYIAASADTTIWLERSKPSGMYEFYVSKKNGESYTAVLAK